MRETSWHMGRGGDDTRPWSQERELRKNVPPTLVDSIWKPLGHSEHLEPKPAAALYADDEYAWQLPPAAFRREGRKTARWVLTSLRVLGNAVGGRAARGGVAGGARRVAKPQRGWAGAACSSAG